jgi:hypothetical protein
VPSSPLVLVDWDESTDRFVMTRAGEPSVTGATDLADAMMAALSRGVDLTIPAALFARLRRAGDIPPELPVWIQVVP